MTDKEKLLGFLGAGIFNFSKDGIVDITKFADYLLENGIVVPPVNLGDTVYWHNGVGVITEYKIKAIQYTFSKEKYMWRLDLGDGLMPVYPHHALFLTREEAEKNVKEQKIAYYKDMKNRAEKDLEKAQKELAKEEG